MIFQIHNTTKPNDTPDATQQTAQETTPQKPPNPQSHPARNRTIAVLFTTFKNNPEKVFIYSNTIKNWASFRPHIQPVLFATFNNTPILDLARDNGWVVLPCPKVNEHGTPFLKDMYRVVNEKFDFNLSAFSNGDILYGSGLTETLATAVDMLPKLGRLLIVGKRWNHKINADLSVYANDPLWKQDKVRSIAKSPHSQLFRPDAEDYFFVTKNFPWGDIKEVVIGRPGYDNYLVARAIQLRVNTIDATLSISAVHQTGADGNYAGHNAKVNKDMSYNHKLIGKFPYGAGLTISCWFQSSWDENNVKITQIKFPT